MSLAWDWPLYSGVPTICSGWVGVWLICCCRYYYPQHSHHTGTCVFPINTFSIVSRQWSALPQQLIVIVSFQIFSLLISLVSSVFCLVSAISHLFHLLTLVSASCAPPVKTPATWPAASCLCLSSPGSWALWQGGELVYPGTDCGHLLTIQPPLLVSLTLLNIVSMFCSLTFMLLLACSKHNITFRNWRRIKNHELETRINFR